MKKETNTTDWLLYGGILCIAIAVVLLLWFFLRGETKVAGEWEGVKKSETFVCNTTGLKYSFLSYDESQKKTTRINVVFNDNKLSAISLMHALYYNNEKLSIDSENLNHANMNKNFSEDGLGFDALGLKFSKFADGLQMSLYVEDDEINDDMMKYFMLDGVTNNEYDMDNMQRIYEEQGFECEINN